MEPLSIFIITKNEERVLAGCLERARRLSDDILVVDSGSTDGTEAIARRFGARFLVHPFDGFGQQKHAAESLCRHRWALNLDADEYLTDGAIREIRDFLADPGRIERYDGARLKTLTVYPGRTKPRLWADYHNYVRLYDREKLRFPCHPMWDAIVPADHGRIYSFRHGAFHYSYASLAGLEAKTRERMAIYFEIDRGRSRAAAMLRLPFEFPVAFFKAYVTRRDMTGGMIGLRVALLYARYRVLRVWQRIRREPAVPVAPAESRVPGRFGSEAERAA